MSKSHSPFAHVETTLESSNPLLRQAIRKAESGDAREALKILARAGSQAHEAQNARGVCLMRMGRHEDALRVFRALVLPINCTWMNPILPIIYRTNFSTCLLLNNLPIGALETLNEIREQNHPSVVRLRAAIDAWWKTLSVWQKVGWYFGNIPSTPVTMEFLPGEFHERMTVSNASTPDPSACHHPPTTQAV